MQDESRGFGKHLWTQDQLRRNKTKGIFLGLNATDVRKIRPLNYPLNNNSNKLKFSLWIR